MLVDVVPTPVYQRQAKRLLTPDEQDQIVTALEQAPDRYPVIPGTHGARKMRAATQGRGKRGGVRVIYLYLKSTGTVYLLGVYGKSEKTNLSEREKKAIAGFIDAIQRDAYGRSAGNA
jgi:mRNA-degrading endonuclease RelE of RelBE toxin-antitoxin system